MLRRRKHYSHKYFFPSEEGQGHSTECSSFKFSSSDMKDKYPSLKGWWPLRYWLEQYGSDGELGPLFLKKESGKVHSRSLASAWAISSRTDLQLVKGWRGTVWELRYLEAQILCLSSEKFDCLFTNSIATCEAKDIIPVTVSVGVCVSFDMNCSTFFCKE